MVGITDAGEYVFYDVMDMAPTGFKVKEEPSTAATGKEAESAIQESSSGGSITGNGLPVKGQSGISEPVESVFRDRKSAGMGYATALALTCSIIFRIPIQRVKSVNISTTLPLSVKGDSCKTERSFINPL